MTLDIGFNFRASVGFATDSAPDNPVTDDGLGENALYPISIGGLNVGWTANPGPQRRDRNGGNNAKLAGHHRSDGDAVDVFRVNLPNAGDYAIRVAMGDASYAAGDMYWRILDNTTQLASVHTSTGSANNFRDATNTEYSAANWLTSNTAVTYTFATTTFFIELGNVAGTASSPLAHLRITEIDTGPDELEVVAAGGMTFAGSGVVADTLSPPVSGGLALSGAAGVGYGKILSGSGGLVFGGHAKYKKVPIVSGMPLNVLQEIGLRIDLSVGI